MTSPYGRGGDDQYQHGPKSLRHFDHSANQLVKDPGEGGLSGCRKGMVPSIFLTGLARTQSLGGTAEA